MSSNRDVATLASNVGSRDATESLPALLLASESVRRVRADVITPGDRTALHPLSYAQERLWFLDQLGLTGSAYNIGKALRLQGDLNRVALINGLRALVQRHEILRTHFVLHEGEPRQVIDPQDCIELLEKDLSDVVDGHRREQDLADILQSERHHRFDLKQRAPLRVLLVKLGQRDHVLSITMHHIISDEWSLGILIRELSDYYAAGVKEEVYPKSQLRLQYADYATWQRRNLKADVLNEQLRYWKHQLRGVPSQLSMVTDHPRPAMESFKGAGVRFELPASLVAALKHLAAGEGCTLFMVFLAAYEVLLSRWTGQQDFSIGSPIAGRDHREFEELIGVFVNMLPLRACVTNDMTFRDLLAKVKEVTLGAYAHQELPFGVLAKELRLEGTLSHQPIFQVMLSLQNHPQEQLELPGLTATVIDTQWTQAHFDLMLYLYEHQNGVSGLFGYATELFDATTVERMASSLRAILESSVSDPDTSVRKISMIDEAERQILLRRWNDTAVPCSRQRLVHEQFEDQVQSGPNAVAVICGGKSLTYAELNAKSNKLARYLRARGVGPDKLVAICLERSVHMLVGLLGILKAGGAYIPLDPTYPSDRIRYMLMDAQPQLLLTQQSLQALLPPMVRTISIDSEWAEIEASNADNLDASELGLTAGHLAYVIYTSGSTGMPKGVMIEHAAVANFLLAMQGAPGMAATDCMLAVTTVSFDIAGLELYLPLASGARLVLADRQAAVNAQALMSMISTFGVTVMQATPTTWQLLLADGWSGQAGLKALCGGEALTTELSRKLVARVGELWNLYGPTETTIWSCARRVEVADIRGVREPIGRPIWNTQVRILDQEYALAPIGVAGELYIGGAGLARGYLNRPGLTAQRFVPDSFSDLPSKRLYRTGDLARWRADGSIEFLGRNDDQVKLRGFRIELGEIEARLNLHPRVAEAVVVAREISGDMRLVAYVIFRAGSVPSAEDLRDHVKESLPEYMIPSVFARLDTLPLTPNGKLDRSALPAPEVNAHVRRRYEPPQGEVEEALTIIWQQLLRVERVGRYNNFFELGGHSLSGIKLITLVAERLGVRLPPASIFQCPTIQQMAELVMSLNSSSAAVPQAEVGEFEQGIL